MKVCPTCKNQYPDDANFCPREECAGESGPQKLDVLAEQAPERFVAVSRMGANPSGDVWQANDSQSGQAVAYKIVAAASLPTPILFERAQRELKQIQRTTSVRIPKVIEFGRTADGALFIASEMVPGEPLDGLIASGGALPLDRAKRIVAQIGEALLEGQKVGIVHRDLCPQNVLISSGDEVRVINFSIAAPIVESVLGFPEYMSPEQAEGKLIDQRSNTYSLGAIFYAMLTGEPPVGGATPQAVLAAVAKGEISPPSIRRGGGLAAEVDRVILKALEKNSSRRPLTMRQFLSDVTALIVTDEQSSIAAAASGNKDIGFARTMMFAGGANEVQKLVAQAVAARQAATDEANIDSKAPQALQAPAARPATPSPAAPLAVPDSESSSAPSSTSRSHGAAVSATMIAISSPAAPIPGAARQGSASPSSPTGAPPSTGVSTPGSDDAAAAAAAGNFRETLWFKKGDVDQLVAEARAKMAAAAASAPEPGQAAGPESGPTIPGEAKPLEDRYVDDGTVTVEDKKKFSLRSGGTSVALPARGVAVPGERMSETEVLGEIGGGRRIMIFGIVGAVVLALAAVIWLSVGGGKSKPPAVVVKPPVAEKVASAPAEAPPAEPEPVAPKADEKAPKEAVAATDEGVAEPAPKPPVVRKKVVPAKKRPAAAAKKLAAPARHR